MLAVVAGTPGLAETQAFSDPVGDVQFFDADAGTFQPADKAAVDITDVGVDHGDATLTLVARVQDYDSGGVDFWSWYISSSGDEDAREAFWVFAREQEARGFLTRGLEGEEIPCVIPVGVADNSLSVEIPRDCLDNPETVFVGALVVDEDEQTPAESRDYWLDEAPALGEYFDGVRADPPPPPPPTETPIPPDQPPPLPRARPRSIDAACPPGAIPAAGFGDVAPDNVHRAAIDCAVRWGIAQGRTAGEYAPSAPVTRAQMASFIARMVRAVVPLPAGEDAFGDDTGDVHEENINALAAAGIVRGRAAGIYSPRTPVPRDQMATFLVRAYEYMYGAPLEGADDYFDDDNASTHQRNINIAAQLGVTGGTGPRTYRPNQLVARDQMASFLMRVVDLAMTEGLVSELPPPPPPRSTPPSPRPNCHPSYDPCVPPPPPDLDCADLPFRNIRVIGDDPHRLDGDGDGIGCEA